MREVREVSVGPYGGRHVVTTPGMGLGYEGYAPLVDDDAAAEVALSPSEVESAQPPVPERPLIADVAAFMMRNMVGGA